MTEPPELTGKAAVDYAAKLRLLSTDADTWVKYYVDDLTGRRWVMEYPDSGRHGGGSPRLRPA
ncbi:Imm27 family immunity protein [Sinorhizobium fredii]|uniref:Imm27 family immunity protein n=1 Tax=Rhizobium fredii TaxID=380 RepID=UPI00056A2F33|nr:Imm27 family immunity protein [Sinorhizobium fredii]